MQFIYRSNCHRTRRYMYGTSNACDNLLIRLAFSDKLSCQLISELNEMNHNLQSFSQLLYNKRPITWWRSREGVRLTGQLPISSRGPSLTLGVAERVLPGGRYAWSGCGKRDRQTFSPPCECVGGATTRPSGRISSRSLPTCTWRASHLWKTDRLVVTISTYSYDASQCATTKKIQIIFLKM